MSRCTTAPRQILASAWRLSRGVVGRIRRDRRGAYSMLVALLMPVLVGFTALGTESGLWLYTHQQMQSASDSAALSAALAYAVGNTNAVTTEGQATAATYGFTDSTGGTKVQVNVPPLSGPNVNTAGAVEVIVSQPQVRLFTALFSSGNVPISARSVAIGTTTGVACVLGLDPTAANTVTLSNNADLPGKICGVASDSNSSTSLDLSNNAVIDGPVTVHGQWKLSNNSKLAGTPNVENAAPIEDPYAGVTPPSPPACTGQQSSGGNNLTLNLQPGHFCSGWNFSNNVTLRPERAKL